MGDVWVALDGNTIWVARGGGSIAPVADTIQMSLGDFRELIMDFGNLTEFFGQFGPNSIDLNIPPVVTITPDISAPVVTNIQSLPVLGSNGTPIGLAGLLFTRTPVNQEPWIGAYYVQMDVDTRDGTGVVAGTYLVSVEITLTTGTVLNRSGTLQVVSPPLA